MDGPFKYFESETNPPSKYQSSDLVTARHKMQERTIADLQTQIADGVRAKFLDDAAADASIEY